jgi:magnesium transporter
MALCAALAGLRLAALKANVKLNVLKENINDIHPVDLADILEELDGSQRMAVFNQIEPELASDTLEEVEPRVQRELIRSMEKERAAELINDMSPAQVADILSACCRPRKPMRLIEFVDSENKQRVQQMIDQHDENIMLYSTQQVIKRPTETL